jgi:hypothetical protein
MGSSYYAGTTSVREVNVRCYFAELDGCVGSRITQPYNHYIFTFKVIWAVHLSVKAFKGALKDALTP